MRNIVKEHKHWQLRGDLKKLLLECRAKESIRYALNGICVQENKLVVTDGRRLVEVEYTHEIKVGNYFCTTDGWLLDFVDGKFPKYQDIIPKKNQLRKIVESTGEGVDLIGLILGELCHAGCICKLGLYKKPAEILSSIIAGTVRVHVYRKEPKNKPFMIEAETTIGHVRYIQMPVTVENQVKD